MFRVAIRYSWVTATMNASFKDNLAFLCWLDDPYWVPLRRPRIASSPSLDILSSGIAPEICEPLRNANKSLQMRQDVLVPFPYLSGFQALRLLKWNTMHPNGNKVMRPKCQFILVLGLLLIRTHYLIWNIRNYTCKVCFMWQLIQNTDLKFH